MKKLLVLATIFIFLASSSLPAFSAAESMIGTLGTDFSSNFGLVIDLNAQGNPNTNTIDTNVQVLQNLDPSTSNSQVNPVDQNPTYDQQFQFSNFKVDGVNNIYLALNKMEFNITASLGGKSFNLGHVNGSAPFQTLLQYFKSTTGADVLVANTFRGLIAYTTSPSNGTLDSTDQAYFGYSFVEQHLLNYLNSSVTNKGFPAIQPYGFENLYFPSNHTFGMKYTNYLVVWQNAQTADPTGVSGTAFNNVATGGQMVGASLFKYLKFTYQVVPVVANSTTTIVKVVTNYDLGPMEWLITTDNANSYTNIVNNDPVIDSTNSFHTSAYQINFQFNTGLSAPLPSAIVVSVNVPELSFYTNDAVPERINAAAMQTAGVDGMGIAVVSSTNAIVVGSTVNAPAQKTNSQDINIPLSFGSTQFFETDFSGKSTYTRYFNNGTTESGLPVYISLRDMSHLSDILDTSSLVSPYFGLQSLQTLGIAIYSAMQLSSGFTTSNTVGLQVDHTDYVTFVEMPQWSGLQVTQDPTFSAVAAVSGNGSSSGNGVSTGAPGFEFYAVVLSIIPIFLYRKKTRKN